MLTLKSTVVPKTEQSFFTTNPLINPGVALILALGLGGVADFLFGFQRPVGWPAGVFGLIVTGFLLYALIRRKRIARMTAWLGTAVLIIASLYFRWPIPFCPSSGPPSGMLSRPSGFPWRCWSERCSL